MCVCFCTKLVAVHCGAAFDIALFIASSPSSAHCCFHSSSVHCHLLLLLSSLQCLEDNVITEERFDRWKSLVRLLAPRFASDRRSRFLLWLCLSLCSLTVTEGRGGGRGGGWLPSPVIAFSFISFAHPPLAHVGAAVLNSFWRRSRMSTSAHLQVTTTKRHWTLLPTRSRCVRFTCCTFSPVTRKRLRGREVECVYVCVCMCVCECVWLTLTH